MMEGESRDDELFLRVARNIHRLLSRDSLSFVLIVYLLLGWAINVPMGMIRHKIDLQK
jgi:hypothetical protein